MTEETRQRSARSNPVPRQYVTQMFTQTQQAILESIFSRVILEQRGGGGGSEQQPQQQQQQNASAQTSSNEMSSEETESTNIDPNVLQPILESIAPESEAFGLESVEDSQVDEEDEESISEEEQQMFLDEFETYDIDLSEHVNRQYGPIGCKLYRQLSRAKLFQIRYGAYDFLRRLLEFFLSNLRGGKVEGYEQLTRLFDCLVPISELKEAVRKQKHKTKEVILLRLLLDLYHTFYHRCNPPPSQIYRKDVLPLLIEFYTNITETMLKSVNQQLKRILSKVKPEPKDEFLFLPTKRDYISYYKTRLKEEINLNEGTDRIYM